MKGLNTILRALTFDVLSEWAGEKVLDRGKGYVPRIMDTDNVNSDPVTDQSPATHPTFVCPKCGTPMIVIDIIEQQFPPRAPPQLQT